MSEEKEQPPQRSQDSVSAPTRRAALRSAVRLTAALSAVGISANTFLAPAKALASEGSGGGLCEDSPVIRLVRHAIETFDMQEAIELHAEEAQLSDASIEILSNVSSEDLEAIQKVREHFDNALNEHTGTAAIHIYYHCDI